MVEEGGEEENNNEGEEDDGLSPLLALPVVTRRSSLDPPAAGLVPTGVVEKATDEGQVGCGAGADDPPPLLSEKLSAPPLEPPKVPLTLLCFCSGSTTPIAC